MTDHPKIEASPAEASETGRRRYGRTCGDEGGKTADEKPCGAWLMPADTRCYTHSATVDKAARTAGRRRGGFAATSSPADLERLPDPALGTEEEIRAARQALYGLVARRLITSAVGDTLAKILEHADRQLDRRRVFTLEERALAVGHRAMVSLAPVFAALAGGAVAAQMPRPVGGTARVLSVGSGE